MPSTQIGFKYNMAGEQPLGSDTHEAAAVSVTTSGTHGGNPFVWLVGIAAVTIGLAGFSVSAHVGKFAAGVKAG